MVSSGVFWTCVQIYACKCPSKVPGIILNISIPFIDFDLPVLSPYFFLISLLLMLMAKTLQ
jgi:hypothetical protein